MARSPIRHLTLNDLTVNPRLARRLSPAVAWRYHALPVAEENGEITVAMADPDDVVALDAITTALGTPPCVVGGDPMAIDALLAEVWPEELQRSLCFLVCAPADPSAERVVTFARALGALLGAHVSYFDLATEADINGDVWADKVTQGGYDLVIWKEPGRSLGHRLISGPAYCKIVEKIPSSLLVTRRPCWPLRRLLLVVQGEDINDVALEWVVRLARPSGADVTALAIVPPVPAMYERFARMRGGLDALLSTDTVLGRQMRRVARQLVDWEVEATLRLREGVPGREIHREITQGDYDLVVLAAQPCAKWRRWLKGDWIAFSLSWADRPVLIAKPKPT